MAESETICACRSGAIYQKCCEPYHERIVSAPTAVALMRSRYTAFVYGKIAYLVETTLPAKRTSHLEKNYLSTYESVRWINLEVLRTKQGNPSDKTAKVDFKASYIEGDHIKVHHECSRFRRKGGKWYYVDAVLLIND